MNDIKEIEEKNQIKWKKRSFIVLIGGFLVSFILYLFAPKPSLVTLENITPSVNIKKINFTKKPIPVIGTGPVYPKTKINLTTQVVKSINLNSGN